MVCAGHRTKAAAVKAAQQLQPGAIGVIKIAIAKPEEAVDVYGEVTNTKYSFSKKTVLFVDVRDAAFLLGKDFVLA
jgi:hypothetical protein